MTTLVLSWVMVITWLVKASSPGIIFAPCQLGKSKKHTHKPKAENTNLEVLNTLHMDLCGPMRVQTINGKKYILVIVDDYSQFTWVKFLRSKDETPKVVIKFITQIHVGLNKTVRYVRTDNGTEFVNHTMTEYYEHIGIFHQKTRSYFSDAWTNKLMPCTQFGSCNSLCTPTNNELEILFQPMFDEYLEPPQAERPDSPAQAVQVSVSSAGTPLSTTIDQDAPSPHISPSSSALQSHSLPPGVVVEPHFMEDHTVAPVDTNPVVNVFAPEPHSEASSSGVSSPLNRHMFLKHFIILINRARITHSIMSLATSLDQYQLRNNSPPMPYGAYTVQYYPKLNRRISNLRLLKTAGFKPCKMRFTNLINFKYGN
nr:putative ribonuclease H-like domain-containing protein [Tanacetum cinerariifolium]